MEGDRPPLSSARAQIVLIALALSIVPLAFLILPLPRTPDVVALVVVPLAAIVLVSRALRRRFNGRFFEIGHALGLEPAGPRVLLEPDFTGTRAGRRLSARLTRSGVEEGVRASKGVAIAKLAVVSPILLAGEPRVFGRPLVAIDSPLADNLRGFRLVLTPRDAAYAPHLHPRAGEWPSVATGDAGFDAAFDARSPQPTLAAHVLSASARDRIRRLPPQTRLAFGHGTARVVVPLKEAREDGARAAADVLVSLADAAEAAVAPRAR